MNRGNIHFVQSYDYEASALLECMCICVIRYVQSLQYLGSDGAVELPASGTVELH